MRWEARNPDGSSAGDLDGYLSLTFKDSPLAPSGWSVVLPANHHLVSTLVQNGAGIAQTDSSEPYGTLTGTVLPGPNETARYSRVRTGQADTITIYGETDRALFWTRVALPDAGSTRWEDTDPAGTVFATMFDDQFGASGLDSSRNNPVLVATGGGPTDSLTIDLPRYDLIGPNLAAILAAEDMVIRTQYVGGEVRYSLEAVDVDLKPRLTVALGTATTERIDVSGVAASRVYVLGAGQGTDRDITTVTSSGVASDIWSLREAAIERSSTAPGDTTTLTSEGTAALNLGGDGISIDLDTATAVKSGDLVRVTDANGDLVERYLTSITINDKPGETVVSGTIANTLDGSTVPASVEAVSSSETSLPRVQGGALGSPVQSSTITRIAENVTPVTVAVGVFTDVGTAVTVTPPSGWQTYGIFVQFETRVDVDAGEGARIRQRVVIDGVNETVKYSWINNPGSAGTDPMTAPAFGDRTGLSGAVDVQVQVRVDELTSGTTLDFDRIEGTIIAIRET